MYDFAYNIVFVLRNESTIVNSKLHVLRYCIIVLNCNASFYNISDLTGPRGATYIDMNVDIIYL